MSSQPFPLRRAVHLASAARASILPCILRTQSFLRGQAHRVQMQVMPSASTPSLGLTEHWNLTHIPLTKPSTPMEGCLWQEEVSSINLHKSPMWSAAFICAMCIMCKHQWRGVMHLSITRQGHKEKKDLSRVSCGCHNKVSQIGWLQQHSFISSQFWRLLVQDHGAHRVSSFWGSLMSLYMTVFSLGLHMVLLLYTFVSLSPLLIRTPVICLGAHPNDLILTYSPL